MNTTFPHHRLDCYTVSLDVLVRCEAILGRAGHGHDKVKDNLRRSASAVPLLIAEGVNRCSPGQKRRRFAEARGEVGEVAAALEVGVLLGVFDREEVGRTLDQCARVGAMLTRLCR